MVRWNELRNQIQARVIADSITETGNRVTTIEATIHRFVLAELNTHRAFSRNSASSRAIPVPKQIKMVRDNPAMPIAFSREQSGMQGGELLDGNELAEVEGDWLEARQHALRIARRLHKKEVHKGYVNRLLEPYLWHTVIITATEWDGFWHQRTHHAAMPEIREAAWQMWTAYDSSRPEVLLPGEWHTPFIQPYENEGYWADLVMSGTVPNDMQEWPGVHEAALELRRRVSAARCARVSYLTHDGRRDIEADYRLWSRLTDRDEWKSDGQPVDPIHWSPLEHVATPCACQRVSDEGYRHPVVAGHRGNFVGFDQFRHIVEDRMRREHR